MDLSSSVLISLIRFAFGRGTYVNVPSGFDWANLLHLSRRHGVSAIAFDGMLSSGIELPKQQMREWMAEAVKIETAYAKSERVIFSLADLYLQAGVPLMVIKGYGLSFDYPIPNHRPSGDIDTWNFGLQECADEHLSAASGINVYNGVHNHSVFSYQGMTVENHFNFFNVYAHKSNRSLDSKLKSMVMSPCQCVSSNKNKNLFFPPVDFNALFLLRHMAAHFAAESITLRHLLDWGTFVEHNSTAISWSDLTDTAMSNNMDRFLACIDEICISDLGFPREAFPALPVDQALKRRVYEDVLDTRSRVPSPGIANIGQRIKRWSDNAWKHKIVYRESLWETFFSQFKAHLMKPASFNH